MATNWRRNAEFKSSPHVTATDFPLFHDPERQFSQDWGVTFNLAPQWALKCDTGGWSRNSRRRPTTYVMGCGENILNGI